MAYKIVNNKISMSRGETPTYNVTVIDKDTGAPFIIASNVNNPVIEFVVRSSVFDRESDYVFKKYIRLTGNDQPYLDVHTFPDSVVEEYNQGSSITSWSDSYDFAANAQNRNRLFRKEIGFIGSKQWEYRYFDGQTWVPYEFRISFMFPYESTSVMEVKTYKYEVTLFGCTEFILDERRNVIGIKPEYKKPLLEATDFTIGGSLSE